MTTSRRTSFFVLLIVGALFADVRAQAPVVPRTAAEARARVAELEQQLLTLQADYIRLQRDYSLLLTTTCPTTPPAPPTAPAAIDSAPPPPTTGLPPGFIKSVDYGVTERNRVFWRYAWTVTVYNGGSDQRQLFDITVQFLDANGLIIDTDSAYKLTVAPFAEGIVRGNALITLPSAFNVASVHALVRSR